ncbi:MAG: VCBS repeat-containing protein [Cyclobacteriaceae bacterium]|nr:VCBS repeat-containing protein [Cyclobacteriaceae bacterium]
MAFKLYHNIIIILLVIGFAGCNDIDNSGKLFTLMPQKHTGIDFSNDLEYTESFNPFTFHAFYNGGGVAAGDINNDGLPDLFF